MPPALDGAVISGSRRVQRGLKVLGLPVMVALQVSPPALRLDHPRLGRRIVVAMALDGGVQVSLGVVQRASRRARLRLGRLCASHRRIAYRSRYPPGEQVAITALGPQGRRHIDVVMPYSVRVRYGAPIAAPMSWSELRDIDTAAPFDIGDASLFAKRAGSRALDGWGVADQGLANL